MQKERLQLGLWAGIAFAAGAMIGPGFFVLPGSAYAEAGAAIVLSYALAALLILPAVLSKCELVSAIPRTGGSYVYVERALGPWAGTVIGGVDWLAAVLKAAFALEGVGWLAVTFLPWTGEWAVRLIAVGVCLSIYVHFLLGARLTAMVLLGAVAFVIAAVVIYACSGVPHLEVQRLLSYSPRSWDAVLAEAGLVCVAFGGVTSLVKVAGEFRTPERTIPRAILWGFGIASCVYLLGVAITVGVADPKLLAASSLPLAVGAEQVMGKTGLVLVELAALVSFATAATTGTFAASWTLWALGRDGLAPAFLGRDQDRRAAPSAATGVTTLAVALACSLLSLETVVKAASAMILLQLIMVELAVLALARSPDFRPLFHVRGQPWLQLFAVIGYAVLLAQLGWVPLLETLAVVVVSSIWFMFYVVGRVRRQSALIELVRSVADVGPAHPALQPELTSIAIQHREPSTDLFYDQVLRAPVIDLEEALDHESLFCRLGQVLGRAVGLPADALSALLLAREQQASTVIGPGLAIPHALVDGSQRFALAIVRCRPGIRFPLRGPVDQADGTEAAPVRAAFAIVCSPDMHPHHLQALVHLARRCSDAEFLERWQAAASEDELRALLRPVG